MNEQVKHLLDWKTSLNFHWVLSVYHQSVFKAKASPYQGRYGIFLRWNTFPYLITKPINQIFLEKLLTFIELFLL